jgi:two-component system cell cycle sensor histidine kinase/response regulator CckA
MNDFRIAGQKLDEEKLRQAHDELEKRVAERTHQLTTAISVLQEEIAVREQAEESLRKSEERYALAVEGANDGIWDRDFATDRTYYSPRWKSMLGYEDHEILNDREEWLSRIHPEDSEMVKRHLSDYLAGRVPAYQVEYRLRHKDGSYRWIHAKGACLRDDGGRPYRMAGSHADITEQKKLEQQLLQARKMESIGLLAGGVAHEFNNLLTAISGCCEELLETIAHHDEVSRATAKMIMSAVTEGAGLTRNLLAFGRPQVICWKPVVINDVVADTGKLLAKTLERNIHFSLDLCSGNLAIMGDEGQIKQMLVNLAINARDAMPSGGYLQIGTRQATMDTEQARRHGLEIPGSYAVISVCDNGVGMDQMTMDRAFEPFFTTKEVGKGTGLGLSIIYGIIKQHNGAITVNSKPGEGATFTICLPLVEPGKSPEKQPEKDPPPTGTETILVAEDEELVRHFLRKMLVNSGYTVITAEDGETAVVKFRENCDSISLVISDVVMPKKSGREMYDEICGIKPDTKVLFISGYSKDMMEKKGMVGEYVHFISKPFAKKDLLDKTRHILGGNQPD